MIGGINMSDYMYLPLMLLEYLDSTSYFDEKINVNSKKSKFPFVWGKHLISNEFYQIYKQHRNFDDFLNIKKHMVSLSNVNDKNIIEFPWFLMCNKHRYPSFPLRRGWACAVRVVFRFRWN